MKRVANYLIILWSILTLSCSPFPIKITPSFTSTDTAFPSSVPTESKSSLPVPALFDTPWNDRTAWRVGLIPQETGLLESLPSVPVYHIELTIDNDLLHLKGRQEVFYTNLENVSLDRLVFHLYPNLFGGSLKISNPRLNGLLVKPESENDDTHLKIPLEPALTPGQSTVLAFDFEVAVPTEGSSNYNTFSYSEGVLALAQFYPLLAVYDDRIGWDTRVPSVYGDVLYADASLYLVRIDAPGSLTLISSGVVTAQDTKNGRTLQTVAAGPVREFYLVASAAFEKIDRTAGPTVVNSYALPGFEKGSQAALDTAAHALEINENWIGRYPFTEFDVVATATGALGVEYPGVVAIASRLYDNEYAPSNPLNPVYLESTVAHETAHQWFFNIIGNDQVSEPWLDEALAQFATANYYQDRYGANASSILHQDWLRRWETIGRDDIPIGLPVEDYSIQEYSAIVYGRGPLFIQALEEKMGDKTLRAFLQDYSLKYRWKISTGNDFKRLAEEECGCSLDSLFNEWVYPEKD